MRTPIIKQKRIRAAWLLGLAAVLLVPAAAAQDGPLVVRAGASRVRLGDGDAPGAYYFAGLERRLPARTAVRLTVGRVSSTELDFDPDDPFTWRYREHVLGDLTVRLDPLRFAEGEAFEHRLGLSAGVSLRHREEEIPHGLYYPALMEDVLAQGYLADYLEPPGEGSFHLYETDEGIYGLQTVRREGTELGGLLALHYSVYVPRLVVAFEVGYRAYREGTPMLHSGVSVGLRL